jgi:hypothetical protein
MADDILDQRLARIEAALLTLATKADLGALRAEMATRAELEALRAEPKNAATPTGQDIAGDSNLRNYAAHAQVFEQVVGLQGQIGGLLNMYMLVTGAVWAVLAPNVFNLPAEVVAAGLFLHIVLSVTVLWAATGMANAVYHRLNFATQLGSQYYPSIEAIGTRVSDQVHKGIYRLFRLGRQRWIYMIVPVIGILGSVTIGIVALRQSEHRDAACQSRREQLMEARDRIALDRAKYLLDKAGCDLKTKP